jgi:hypothetical protein
MRKTIISLVAALAGLVPVCLLADGMPPEAGKAVPGAAAERVTQGDLQPNAPDEYTVVKGDTLWGISGRFLKDPWKWPQIWQMNREQIKDPHWIYPGDVIHLDRSGAYPYLSINGGGGGAAAAESNVVKLQPRVRIESIQTAIPTIPASALGPFLTQPLVIEAGGLDAAPTIIATQEGRVAASAGETAYADRIAAGPDVNWQVYRPGVALHDPDSGEILGYEAKYVADARVRRFGNPTTLQIVKSVEEVVRGDKLAPARETTFPSYVPHAPDRPIVGAIMSVEGGVAEIGQYQVVTINRGSRDGIEVGHVLASYHRGAIVGADGHDSGGFVPQTDWFKGRMGWFKGADVTPVYIVPPPPAPAMDDKKGGAVLADSRVVKLPDERNGLIFVFRVFDRMSYAMVMRATQPIYLGDVVRTP